MHVNTFLEPHKSYPFYRIAKFSLFSKGSAKRFGSVQPYMFGLRVRFGSAILLENVRFGRTSKSNLRKKVHRIMTRALGFGVQIFDDG